MDGGRKGLIGGWGKYFILAIIYIPMDMWIFFSLSGSEILDSQKNKPKGSEAASLQYLKTKKNTKINKPRRS